MAPVTETAVRRLAPGQETLWHFMRALSPHDPGDSRVTVLDVRELTGDLDAGRLRDAAAVLTQRHQSLRLAFDGFGPDPELRLTGATAVPLTRIDLTGAAGRPDELRRLVRLERVRSFDLCSGPLWHLGLIRTAPDRHTLTLSLSHVIADQWAADLFVEDLLRVYSATPAEAARLAEPAVTLDEITALHRAVLPGGENRLRYWRENLTPLPDRSILPALDASPEVDLGDEGSRSFTFGVAVAGDLPRLAWRARTTPFVALLAAYQLTLALRTGLDRIVLGTTTLGRDAPAAREALSQFTNNVYLNLPLDPAMRLVDVVAAAGRAMSDAVGNVASFGQIRRAVGPGTPSSFLELYHGWFQSWGVPRPDPSVPGLLVRRSGNEADGPAARAPKTEATHPGTRAAHLKAGTPHVMVAPDRGGGRCIYHPGFFATETVDQLIEDYVHVVAAVVHAPELRAGELRLPSRPTAKETR
ncbi:condensation domain-containing protein [Catenuloplanes indicus]|uniref:Condensation domain-containing protein n=1 Tax=Catenuloplanes indicus TaxID=137267 RepID=A0AAE4AWN7_9ACTN|nr:condensation domain-containing protein [Catenuloplanes indicus]MDQ0364921.1 hypothetical protein [Catenuloplanes indicus]